MTVGQLIERLKQCDPDTPVCADNKNADSIREISKVFLVVDQEREVVYGLRIKQGEMKRGDFYKLV